MSEISETEIKKLTKAQNYFHGYFDGKSDILYRILEELSEAGAYEQEVNGKTEFLSGISYCISVINKYMESEEMNESTNKDTNRNIK